MQVIRYVSTDNTEWDTQEKADKRDSMLEAISKAMLPLGPKIKDSHCDFANGGGYVQHNPAAVLATKCALIELAKTECPDDFWSKYAPEEIHPMSHAGRLLDGHILWEPWSRLARIDEYAREWGQAYYALNPREGKQVVWIQP